MHEKSFNEIITETLLDPSNQISVIDNFSFHRFAHSLSLLNDLTQSGKDISNIKKIDCRYFKAENFQKFVPSIHWQSLSNLSQIELSLDKLAIFYEHIELSQQHFRMIDSINLNIISNTKATNQDIQNLLACFSNLHHINFGWYNIEALTEEAHKALISRDISLQVHNISYFNPKSYNDVKEIHMNQDLMMQFPPENLCSIFKNL